MKLKLNQLGIPGLLAAPSKLIQHMNSFATLEKGFFGKKEKDFIIMFWDCNIWSSEEPKRQCNWTISEKTRLNKAIQCWFSHFCVQGKYLSMVDYVIVVVWCLIVAIFCISLYAFIFPHRVTFSWIYISPFSTSFLQIIYNKKLSKIGILMSIEANTQFLIFLHIVCRN